MPGAQWFPDGTLNYAEHALRTPPGMTDDHVAVLTVVEGGADSTLTIGSAAGPGRTAAGLGVGPGDRGRRVGSDRPTRAGRIPCHGRAGSGRDRVRPGARHPNTRPG
jgi:hypothetical protein